LLVYDGGPRPSRI